MKATDDVLNIELRAYYSNRVSVPPQLQEQIMTQIRKKEAIKTIGPQTSPRWIWSVVLYDFLISSAILYILWVFFGQSLVVYGAIAFVGFSLLAAVIITLANHRLAMPKERNFAPICTL